MFPLVKNSMMFINIVSIIVILSWLYNNYFYIIEYYSSRYLFYSNITLKPSESKNLLLLSNSTMSKIGSDEHLGYALPILNNFLKPHNIKEILVITYASSCVIRDDGNIQCLSKLNLENITDFFQKLGIKVNLLDIESSNINQQSQIKNAEAIYITGGNTFLLTKALYEKGVIDIIKGKIREGIPFIGSSAGTIIHCPTIKTTNDMPIVCLDNCNLLNSIPFQINAHYNNIENSNGFRMETRDKRLKEYLENNRTIGSLKNPNFVIGLKEGSMIHVSGDKAELAGFNSRPAELLMLNKDGDLIKKQIKIGSRIDDLMLL
jgi:dipeptidase E